MQALAKYNDDSGGEETQPQAGPSRPGNMKKRVRSPRSQSKTFDREPSSASPLPENLSDTTQKSLKSTLLSKNALEPSILSSDLDPQTVNVNTRNGNAGGKNKEKDNGNGKGKSKIMAEELESMNEDELFRLLTRPEPIQGVEDYGIPPAIDPSFASSSLTDKVAHFLRLKRERGQHINTSLLSSSTFANPHIYSKLVEFVSIDESATAFPRSGWLTRRGLTTLIPTAGPQAILAQQNAMAEAVKRNQEIGKRKEIGFAPARFLDDHRFGSGRDRGGSGGGNRGRSGGGEEERKEREKERRRKEERRGRDPYRSYTGNGSWAGGSDDGKRARR